MCFPIKGKRIESLLESANLTGQMAVVGYEPDSDREINWMEVDSRLQDIREQSMELLRRNMKS